MTRGRTPTGARDPRERGAVLVESALILPLVVLLTFGIIEFSYVYFTTTTMGEATRNAARVGAQLGQQDKYWEDIEDVAASQVRLLPNTANPVNLWIYRANDLGYPGSDGNDDFSFDTFLDCYSVNPDRTCMIRAWDGEAFGSEGLGFLGATWDPKNHKICGDDVDLVGVAVTVEYDPIMGFFDPMLRRGPGNAMDSHTVFTFEPGISAQCGE